MASFRGASLKFQDIRRDLRRALCCLLNISSYLLGCRPLLFYGGKQEGVDKIVASSVINPGRTVEIAEVKSSGESCSMKNGNFFGE